MKPLSGIVISSRLAFAAMLLGLPLTGILWTGQDIRPYLEFPPLTEYVIHAPFSWPVFIGLAVFLLAVLTPFAFWMAKGSASVLRPPRTRHPFPAWGWLALAFLVLSWVLAWSRIPAFAPLQPFTFSPLWFSYIAVIHALIQWRTGQCPLLRQPGFIARLFLASAAFWWFFEYLNRFVQNWVYQNVEGLSPWQYFLYATLPFSTVLPAVHGTHEWLKTFPRLAIGREHGLPFHCPYPRGWAAAALVLCGAGLAFIGVWPDVLFPLLWLSPLVILVSLQSLQGKPHQFSTLKSGGGREILLWALAALVCGLFWEMWNWHSLARWVYRIPFVHRFPLFEMPLLGYAGYLTFGLECAAVIHSIARPNPPASAHA